MTPRPTLISRWLAQPAELLQQTTLRARTPHRALANGSSTTIGTTATRSPNTRLSSTSVSVSVSTLTRRLFTSLPTRSNTTTTTTTRRATRPFTKKTSNSSQYQRASRRFNSNSTTSKSSSSSSSGSGSGSLSERLRTLSREYGWAALGVYLGLSALDFPFCFVAVRLLGVERIGYWEHVVMQSVKDAVKTVWPVKEKENENDDQVKSQGQGGKDEQDGALVRAEEANREEASIWTQLALAYAIHKSFIFIRVPLTAAVTPKIVKVLRRWGWDIGKRKPKST